MYRIRPCFAQCRPSGPNFAEFGRHRRNFGVGLDTARRLTHLTEVGRVACPPDETEFGSNTASGLASMPPLIWSEALIRWSNSAQSWSASPLARCAGAVGALAPPNECAARAGARREFVQLANFSLLVGSLPQRHSIGPPLLARVLAFLRCQCCPFAMSQGNTSSRTILIFTTHVDEMLPQRAAGAAAKYSNNARRIALCRMARRREQHTEKCTQFTGAGSE